MAFRSARPSSVVLASVLLALAACSSEEDSDAAEAPVGTIIDSVVTVAGTTDFVMTPEGRINVTIAPPASDLAGFNEEYDRAADGASLVGVEWTYEIETAPRNMTDPRLDPVVPSFTLVADGEEYSLDEVMIRDDDEIQTDGMPVEFRGSVAVSVKGKPTDVSVQVEYDGATQAVPRDDVGADEGPAALLYRSPSEYGSRDRPCGEAAYEPVDLSLDPLICDLSVARVPYHQSVGWAPEGSHWLTVRSRVQVGSAVWQAGTDGELAYNVVEVSDQILLGRDEPEERTLPEEPTSSPQTFAVFEIPADTSPELSELDPLRLVATASAEGDYDSTPEAPTDPAVTARWSVPLG